MQVKVSTNRGTGALSFAGESARAAEAGRSEQSSPLSGGGMGFTVRGRDDRVSRSSGTHSAVPGADPPFGTTARVAAVAAPAPAAPLKPTYEVQQALYSAPAGSETATSFGARIRESLRSLFVSQQ